jgi:hypothetical protein
LILDEMVAVAKWHFGGQDVDLAFSNGHARMAALVRGVSMVTHVFQIGMRVEDARVACRRSDEASDEWSDENSRRK